MVFGQLVMLVQCRTSAQQCTGMTNWPNTIQYLGSDDIMSLGIKSSAFLKVEHPFSWKFEVQILLTSLQLVASLGKNLLGEFGPIFFDMSSSSGNVGKILSRNVVA